MSHYQGIMLWTEVVCTGCCKTTAGAFVRHGRRQMRMVMAELEKEGWKNVDGDARCPECLNAMQLGINVVTLPTPFKGQ